MKKKKIVLIAIGVLAAAAVGFMFFRPSGGETMALPVELSPLQKTTLRSTISTSGNVESTNSVNVYSTQSYPIKDILVKVGDHVNEGDVLCVLDSKELQDQIKQKQLALSTSGANNQQQIKSSQKKYDDAMETLNAGLNTDLNTAQQSVDDAKRKVDTAQKDLNEAKARLDSNLNTELISAQSSFETAETALGRAEKALKDRRNELGNYYSDLERDYQKALKEYERAVKKDDDDVEEKKADVLQLKQDLADAENEADALYMKGTENLSIDQLRRNVTDAQQAYDTAKQSLDAAKKAVNDQLGTYETGLTTAKDAYNNALKSQKAAQTAVTHGLEDDLQSIETNKLSADDRAAREELKTLQENLGKCTVTAPVSGTITAVYAVEGAAPNGVLFEVENTDTLQIDVKIKEYDVNTIKPNMAAIIKADATGDIEYEGYLEKVAPTAVKTQASAEAKDTATNKDVEFDATILVSSKETGLRIGMTANADIVTEQKENVFAVPYDAIATAADGSSVIYTVKPQADGTTIAEAVPITMGLETDYEVEITGAGLTEGMQIISDGKQIQPGMPVTSMPNAGVQSGAAAAGQGGTAAYA